MDLKELLNKLQNVRRVSGKGYSARCPAHDDRNNSLSVDTSDDGKRTKFKASVCIDTPKEWQYYKHGGILQYVIRQLAA